MDELFRREVEQALQLLKNGGVLLYPTDTVWGLGCDATNEAAVRKIFEIKKRADTKSMIVLVAEERDLLQYVAAPDPAVFDFLEEQTKPTTIIYENAIGLAANVVAEDGSVAIRIVQDDFCRHLIKRLQQPIVSTSANISGEPAPASFTAIAPAIKSAVDHIVSWRQDDATAAVPSQIIRWNNGNLQWIRR